MGSAISTHFPFACMICVREQGSRFAIHWEVGLGLEWGPY